MGGKCGLGPATRHAGGPVTRLVKWLGTLDMTGPVLAAAIALMFGTMGAWTIFVSAWFAMLPDAAADPSSFGDAFGPVAGILTALALVLAVWSVLLQRQELQETRAELRGQREAQERQTRIQALANVLELEQLRLRAAQINLELWNNSGVRSPLQPASVRLQALKTVEHVDGLLDDVQRMVIQSLKDTEDEVRPSRAKAD